MKLLWLALLTLGALLVVIPVAGAGAPGSGTLHGPPVVGPRIGLDPRVRDDIDVPGKHAVPRGPRLWKSRK